MTKIFDLEGLQNHLQKAQLPPASSERLASLTAWELQAVANLLEQDIERLEGEIYLLTDEIQASRLILGKLREMAVKGEGTDD